MRPGTVAALVALAALSAGTSPVRGEEPPVDAALWKACVDEMPKSLAQAETGAPRYRAEGEAGRWSVHLHDLDGDGVEEAVLIALPEGRSGEVTFLYRKDGAAGEWDSKRVKLDGGPVTDASLNVQSVGNGQSLAWVNAGSGGQSLLYWTGEKLETVWKTGRPREGERRWFVLEDLDENGVDEVVEYFQRELDVFFADEDDLTDGTAGNNTTRVDAVAVYRLDDGKWKKDRDLLENRRGR
ncbi:MAG TPA: hypothetical protein VKU85_18330 [bacterium]|nr:hypothetical protein [bacterium]